MPAAQQQQQQLHRIHCLTRSLMQPLLPAWACCQMLRAQLLPMTVTHRWQQQRLQLRAPIIIRAQWP